MFNSYVKLPEGIFPVTSVKLRNFKNGSHLSMLNPKLKP